MSDKIREAFSRIYPKIADGVRPSAFSIFKEGYEAGVALAQQATQAAPDGWKLVPIRATREQVNAVCMHPDLARTLYRNMAEAAPAAPAPAAQEPVAQCPFCGEPSGHCNQGFPHPRKTAKALCAAEQPDTVPVPRELLRELADIADSMQCFDARDDAMGLLDKEGE